MNNKNCRV